MKINCSIACQSTKSSNNDEILELAEWGAKRLVETVFEFIFRTNQFIGLELLGILSAVGWESSMNIYICTNPIRFLPGKFINDFSEYAKKKLDVTCFDLITVTVYLFCYILMTTKRHWLMLPSELETHFCTWFKWFRYNCIAMATHDTSDWKIQQANLNGIGKRDQKLHEN